MAVLLLVFSVIVLLPVLWMIGCFISTSCQQNRNPNARTFLYSRDAPLPTSTVTVSTCPQYHTIFNSRQSPIIVPGQVQIIEHAPPPSYEEAMSQLKKVPYQVSIFTIEQELSAAKLLRVCNERARRITS